jgi:hypothetical protein
MIFYMVTYGAAGKPIRQYIDVMREELLKNNKPMRIFGSAE